MAISDVLVRLATGRTAAPGAPGDTGGDRPPRWSRAFTLNALSGGCSKLAEQLASPDVVLTSLLVALGASSGFVGALEPFRRGFATLPQLLLAPWLRRATNRSRVWAGAALGQAAVWAVLAVATSFVTGASAGLSVLLAVAVFSVLSGAASAVFSDVTGATVDRSVRGRLMSLRSGLGGLATVLFSIYLIVGPGRSGDPALYVALLAAAAGLWLGAAVLFGLIGDRSGPATGDAAPLQTIRRGLGALRQESWFAAFSATRALLTAIEIVIPYLTLLTHQRAGAVNLGLLILTVGVAQIVGSPIWGRVSDLRSPGAALSAAGIVGVAGIAVAIAADLGSAGAVWPYLLALLLAGLAREGVRTGRKTYLVNAAPSQDRSLYTATSNSLTGVLLLLTALLGPLAQATSALVVLYLLASAAGVGSAVALRLPRR